MTFNFGFLAYEHLPKPIIQIILKYNFLVCIIK